MQVAKFWKMCSAGNLDFARVNNLGASERGAQGDLLTSESKSAAGQSWRRAAILIQHNNCFWKLAILNVTTEHFQVDTTPPSKPHKPRQPRGDTFPHVVAVSREQSKLSDYPDQVASTSVYLQSTSLPGATWTGGKGDTTSKMHVIVACIILTNWGCGKIQESNKLMRWWVHEACWMLMFKTMS